MLILVGVMLWTTNLIDNVTDLMEAMGNSDPQVSFADLFQGEQSWNFILVDYTLRWRLGYGYYMAAGGGVLALIGANTGSDYK